LELIDFQCSSSRVSDPKGPASSSAEFKDLFEWRLPHNKFSFKKTPGSPGVLKPLTELYNQSVQSWSSELVELLNTLPDVIYRIDEKGNFTYLSPSIERWGYETQTLIGKHFSTLIDPLDVDRVSREKVIETYRGTSCGQEGAPGLFNEWRSGDRSTNKLSLRALKGPKSQTPGQSFHVELSSSGCWKVLEGEEKVFVGTVGIVRDVEDRIQSAQKLSQVRENLVRAERFAGLGSLAAGLAHDLNNILQIIYLESSVLKVEPEFKENEAVQSSMDKIQECLDHCSSLTNHLLMLGRSKDKPSLVSNPEKVAQNAANLFSRQLKSRGIQLKFKADTKLPSIYVDSSQFHDCILNMMKNSMEAFEEAGFLKSPDLYKPCIKVILHSQGKDLVTVIEDNGPGIPEGLLDKVFDPFFSTKEQNQNRGSGLGLSMVYAFAQNFGASVQLESELSRQDKLNGFTRIQITLPGQIEKKEIDNNQELEASSVDFPSALIHIVEDEPLIRDAIVRILFDVGYGNVHDFPSSKELLEHIQRDARVPDLVLTDLQMPGMTGLELIQRLRSLNWNPRPEFMVVSGFLFEEKVRKLQEMGIDNLYLKPFALDSLARRVNTLLNERLKDLG